MKTSHTFPVHVEIERESTAGLASLSCGAFTVSTDELIEITLTARVSLINGTRDDLEVEWLGPSEALFDDLTDAEQEGATERAEQQWWDAMRDEPTDEEVRADYELQRWKEERYAAE